MSQANRQLLKTSQRPQPVKATQPFSLKPPPSSPTKIATASTTTTSTRKSPRSSPSLLLPQEPLRFAPWRNGSASAGAGGGGGGGGGTGGGDSNRGSPPERRSPTTMISNSKLQASPPPPPPPLSSSSSSRALPRAGSLDTLVVAAPVATTTTTTTIASSSSSSRCVTRGTQTNPDDFLVDVNQIHKRSASLGSVDLKARFRLRERQLTPDKGLGVYTARQGSSVAQATSTGSTLLPPITSLGKNMRMSVEGLNQEVETLVCKNTYEETKPCDVPDGHKAPFVYVRRGSIDVETQTLESEIGQESLIYTSPGLPAIHSSGSRASDTFTPSLSPLLLYPPSPKCSFARDPPVGAERVQGLQLQATVAIISQGPDRTKVGFHLRGEGTLFSPIRIRGNAAAATAAVGQ
ncbi:protein FAM117B-like isoform X2 [Oscarella lobularis]|uniref:protein FAM117B-like isoform X2 n=1 Tax=Oscarella lobularis TaxID=121494 RepID=UPI0033144A04